MYRSSTNYILDLFNVCPGTIYFLNINKKKILIISNEYYVKLILDNNKIIKLFFNNHEILKYKEFDIPFKYVIPNTCLHLIYEDKDNNEYNIIYFINNKYDKSSKEDSFGELIKEDILGDSTMKTGMYKITINKNNLMFPNKDCYQLFSDLCKNYDINNYNIIYLNEINSKSLLCYNQNYDNLYNFNKNNFLKEELIYTNYNKINFIKNIEKYKKLQLKINKCTIKDKQKLIDKINYYLDSSYKIIKDFTINFKVNNIKYLFDNYSELYNYLLNIKINSLFTILLNNLQIKYDDEFNIFCSQVKIFNDYFNIKKQSFKYKFEALFELICGNELLEEQMNRYIDITNSYEEEIYYNKNILLNNDIFNDTDILQQGGKNYNYPLSIPLLLL